MSTLSRSALRVALFALAALALTGCTVTYTEYPYDPSYTYPSPYAYRSYYYRPAPYYRGYYWHQAP